MEGTKRCAVCENDVPRGEFYADKSRRDGLARLCKACNRQQNAERYARNAESERRRYREWRAANLDRAKAADRDKYRRNRGVRAAQARAWALAHPDRHAEFQRASRIRNRERNLDIRRQREAARRAAKAGASSVPFTQAELDARLAYYGRRCWMCGGAYEHLDHVKPLNKGGPHILANLRPACGSCNIRKSATWPYSLT